MNRYVDLRDGCSNTFFTTGSLFSLGSAAWGGSCRHGRCVGVISVSLCKQEMTVKDGIIRWSVMNDVTGGNNEKDRKRGNERFSMCATSIFWCYESTVVTRIFSMAKNVQNSINTRVSYVFYIYTDTALCFNGLVLLTVWLLCYLQWANLKQLCAISGQVVFTKPNDFDERY